MSQVPSYEKLGAFYLGRKYDLASRTLLSEDVLYDAKDLNTHAMCVGMTGSGKTGLCLSLLEEAAIDGIPAICIDPKGDLGNLLLTFPNLQPSDFEPYLEPADATRQGVDLQQLAAQTAARWKEGLATWGQEPDRIKRFRNAVDITIYTPGSIVGLPLTVLKSFDAPPQAVLDDAETMREKVTSAASGLLTLLGVESDPLTSREHILLSTIFDKAWRAKRNLDLPELIRQIQSPQGIDRVGVLDLETFLPTEQRVKLAMSLNNLLASPAFAGWLEGEPLDIKRMLYTADGKPRLTILSIAHLSDAERMFFVTIFLGELLSWMRSQPGTSSLRAIFYMDEVFGYFPPSAKPPSKQPMLTLLKQARAFGLGIVLATQNPVDLDYKGLSNMGTWFLGRLQTARDKERVLEGLEGAAAQTGKKFNRQDMETTLAALGNRVFLMNNVNDDAPTIFQSRWALSFLRGPLSRQQIQKLMEPKRSAMAGTSGPSSKQSPTESSNAKSPMQATLVRPIVPADVTEKFLIPSKAASAGSRLVYRPAVLGQASLHYIRVTSDVDHWQDVNVIVSCSTTVPDPLWNASVEVPPDSLELASQPEDEIAFSDLPPSLSAARNFSTWERELKDYLFRHNIVRVFHSKALKRTSRPGQAEDEARVELAQAAREARDAEVEKLRAKFASKIKSLETRILSAQQRVEKQKEQFQHQSLQTVLNFGTSIVGALLGGKLASRTNVTKAATAARGLGRAAQERGDVTRASETLEELQADRDAIEVECREGVDQVGSTYSPENLALETIEIPSRKSDTRIKLIALVWVPWQIDSNGIATALVDLPKNCA